MTAIVGFTDGNTVSIGGDSAGVAGLDLTVRSDSKVFKNGEFIFGFTTSFRMGQLIRYRFKPPAIRENQDLMEYMTTDFVDDLRACLKNGGFAEKDKEQERGGTFLVGLRGRLFQIASDYQVGESLDGYDACGCGESFLLGAMFATKNSNMSTEARLLLALAAAERHSAGVRAPFVVDSITIAPTPSSASDARPA